MIVAEAFWSLTVMLIAAIGIVAVTRNTQTKHLHRTHFYREADTWKKLNFPGYEK